MAMRHIVECNGRGTYSEELAKSVSITQPTAWRCLRSLAKKGVVRPLENRCSPKEYELSELGKALAWFVQLDEDRLMAVYRVHSYGEMQKQLGNNHGIDASCPLLKQCSEVKRSPARV